MFVVVCFVNSNCRIQARSDTINGTTIIADDVDINPVTKKSYFISHDQDKIYVLDENTKKISTVINAPKGIEDLAIDNKTNLIYVGFHNYDKIHDRSEDGFYVINGSTDRIYDTINASWVNEFKVDPMKNIMYILDSSENGPRLYELNLKTKNL